MTNDTSATQNSRGKGARVTSLAVTAAVAFILGACGTLHSKPPANVQLSGQWKLNEELSEAQTPATPPGPQSSSHRGGMGHHGGGMSGGRGGGGYGGGGYGGSGGYGRNGSGGTTSAGSSSGSSGSSGSTATAATSRQPFARAKEISIDQGTKELKLSADGVASVLVYGEKITTTFGRGEAERSDGWKDSAFVVEYATKQGQKITQKYEILDDENQLIVTTSMEGRRKMEFQTVYDRAPSK